MVGLRGRIGVLSITIVMTVGVGISEPVGVLSSAAEPEGDIVLDFERWYRREGGVQRIEVGRDPYAEEVTGSLTVQLTTIPDHPDGVPFSVPATPDVDYTPTSVTIEWGDGDRRFRTLDLEVFSDGIYEGIEDVWFRADYLGTTRAPSYHRVGYIDQTFASLDTPARIADTRVDGTTVDGTAAGIGRIPAMKPVEIAVTGRPLGPENHIGWTPAVPDGAAGITVNATVVDPDDHGFLTLYDCSADVPGISNLNYAQGETTGNGSMVELSSSGTICAYSRAEIDLVLDITGYVQAEGSLVLAEPARLADTRIGSQTADGVAVGGGPIPAGTIRRVPIAGRAGVPVDASAVFLNVTAVNPADRGHVAVYDCSPDRPNVSSLNHPAGVTTGNGALTAMSPSGEICLFSRTTVDVVVDLVGWSDADGDPGAARTYRMLDTRGLPAETDGGGLLRAGRVLEIRPFSLPGIDVFFGWSNYLTVTVVDPVAAGNVRVYPCGRDVPNISTINVPAGQTRNNNAFVRAGSEAFCIWSSVDTHLVIDLVGAWDSADGE